MCSEVIIFFFFFYYTKILKTAAISPLHTGHSETALEQLAQRQRWPHGTTAYSGSPSQQMAHSAVAGSVEAGLGGWLARLLSDVRRSTSAQVRRICSSESGWDPDAMTPRPRALRGHPPKIHRSAMATIARGGGRSSEERMGSSPTY